jgi:hypothetical protein
MSDAVISLLLPVRGRPANVARFLETVDQTASVPGAVEVVFYIDDDDPTRDAILGAIRSSGRRLRKQVMVLPHMGALWDCSNTCWCAAAGDIFGLFGDDAVFRSDGWDAKVRAAFARFPDRVAFVHGRQDDGLDGQYGSQGFVSREWTDAVGYFLPAGFKAYYVDTWLNDVANALGRRVYLADVFTEHAHPSMGKAEVDDLYRERFAYQVSVAQHDRSLYDSRADERARDVAKLRAVMSPVRPFAATLNRYLGLLRKRTPMVAYRFADGEVDLVEGRPIGETSQAWKVDRWSAPARLTRLGLDLRTVLDTRNEAAHFGISCPCCDPAGYKMLSARLPGRHLFPANLWINGNHSRFREALPSLGEGGPVALVCSERATLAALPFGVATSMRVPDDVVMFYEKNRDVLIARARSFARDLRGTLVLLAAGPLSEALAFFMWNENPRNTYVDVGSSLDAMTHGRLTRAYMDPTSEYSWRECALP